MRKLIAGMKISADGMVRGPEGSAHWVAAWSDDYGLTPQVDACVLGGGMYPEYEGYWTAIQNEPDKPVWSGGPTPTPGEVDWARFAAHTPHYVLSRTLTSAGWPQTSFLRDSTRSPPSSSSLARTSTSSAGLGRRRAVSTPSWSTGSGSLSIR
jgi:hypothetical protein